MFSCKLLFKDVSFALLQVESIKAERFHFYKIVLVLLMCSWFHPTNVTYLFSFQQSSITEPVEKTSRIMILFKLVYVFFLLSTRLCNFLEWI